MFLANRFLKLILFMLLQAAMLFATEQGILRLTVYEGNDYPRGWSAEGRGIFVESPRTKVKGFLHFRQGSGRPELMVIPVKQKYKLPAWSRDNTLLAFILIREELEELWIYSLNQNRLQKIYQEETITDVAWSEKTDRLVFCAGNMRIRYFNIYQYLLSSGKVQTLVENGRLNYHPVLSPSGVLLVYTTKPAASLDLYQYDFKTRASTPLLAGETDEQNPVWYAEGALLYLGDTGFRQEVFRYDFSSGKSRRLTDNRHSEYGFILSPDKSMICFYDYIKPVAKRQHTDVFLLNLAGGPVEGFVAEQPGWEAMWRIEQEATAIKELYRLFEEIGDGIPGVEK